MGEIITIDGVLMPAPVSYKVTLQDLDSDNTTRSETGFLTRDRVRPGVYKIELSWKVSMQELGLIVNALSPPQITVVFLDPTQVAQTTALMYASDRQGGYAGSLDLWDLSVSLTEY